jgi:hypothetical protein
MVRRVIRAAELPAVQEARKAAHALIAYYRQMMAAAK